MSNLSELLPTGGGQNSVDFVASGTLSSGVTVALKADGTVEAITGVADGAGTPVVFEAASSSHVSSTFDSANNKIIIAYSDSGTSDYGTAIVGTVSGTSISFGTAVVYNSGSTYFNSATFDSTNNKVVIAYRDDGNSQYGTAIVGTVSGTSISFGSEVVFETAESTEISSTYDSTSGKIVIAYRDKGNSSHGTAIVGTVSGTSISFGSAVVYNSATTTSVAATFDSTANKVVIAYRDGGNSNYGTAIVGTVSGTSISFGSEVVFESATTIYISAAFDSNSGKVVIAYRDDASVFYYGTAIVGTVSGTSISFGSPAVFNAALTTYTSTTFDSTSNKVVIAYTTNPLTGLSIVGTVSGTSISFGSATTIHTAGSSYTSATYDSNANKVVIAYQDNGNSSYGTAAVITVGSSNNTSFIGITSEAISSGATGAINTYGGINTAQTGLTIASDYYVQIDGSLSTTTSTVKAGQAISATTINMKDLT